LKGGVRTFFIAVLLFIIVFSCYFLAHKVKVCISPNRGTEQYDTRILGNGDFVANIERINQVQLEDYTNNLFFDYDFILSMVAAHYCLPVADLLYGKKHIFSTARKVLVYLLCKYTRLNGQAIARKVSKSAAAVSKMKSQGENLCQITLKQK
jgi:hypothetical protein